MNKRSNIPVLLGLAGLILIIILWWLRIDSSSTDWNEHFIRDSKDPYGSEVIFQLLDQHFGDSSLQIVQNELSKDLPLEESTLNYLFLGDGMLIDTSEIDHLLEFVANGNTAMLIAREFPWNLFDQIYYAACDEFIWFDLYDYLDTIALVGPIHEVETLPDPVRVRYVNDKRLRYYRWSYLTSNLFCESAQQAVKIGRQQEKGTNFAKFPYGDGVFYIHTTPLAFSNYNMRTKGNLDYASWVFSHLPSNQKTYWDAAHQIEAEIVRNMNEADDATEEESGNRFDKDGPLRYILSQPALAWAWYLGLAMAILFIAFRAKRRQRIIPVLPQNENTSLEFIQAISRLALKNKDHRQIALMHWRSFQQEIRNTYHLTLGNNEALFCKKLAQLAEVPEATIQEILNQQKGIQRATTIEAKQLLTFHQALDRFYQKSKKAL